MKRWIIVCLLGLTVALAGAVAFADAMDDVLARGKLIIGTHLASPPWQYLDPETGKPVGFVIDLVQMFCNELGVSLEVIDLEWAALMPGLLAGKFDMWAADISRTVPRAAKLLYTEPIAFDPGAVVAKKGRFTSLDEINRPDVTVSTELGNVWQSVAAERFPNAKLVTFPSGAEHFLALHLGRSDAGVEGLAKCRGYIETLYPDLEIVGYVKIDSFAFAVRYDSPKLKHAFDIFLRIIKLDGRYGELYKKWFGVEWEPVFTELGL